VTVRLVLALAAVAVPGWVLATRWSAVLDGHPALLVLLVALVVTGLLIGARSRRPRAAGRWRCAARVATAGVLVAILAATVWLRPFPAQRPATASAAAVTVVDGLTTWELRPSGPVAPTGVVFYPGALVDPRAYLALLRPLAEAGHTVVLVKPPLGVALLAGPPPFPDGPQRWVVGGHSLGGAAAAMQVDDARVAGLLLWAAYPAGDLSGSALPVLSVSGDRDGLATPADIASSREQLPPDTRYVVVAGGLHAYFGDYGSQPGDGIAGVSRFDAQRQIVAATVEFVSSVR
jgi:pimeloyl-ACP methyl ester carboxylesterase